MKLLAKSFKEIEDNPDNEFAQDTLYINNVSLIGFGLGVDKGRGDKHLYIDIALRLDDLKSIIKLILMYEVSDEEFKAFADTAYRMPDRGITGYCPVMMFASNSFTKDKDEYYIYSVNGRNNEDNFIYTLSFDIVGMSKIYYYIGLVQRVLTKGEKIDYYKTDYYEALHIDNVSSINLTFTNQYETSGFVVPKKKLFEKAFNCFCLAHFKYNRNIYYIYFNTIVTREYRHKLRRSPYSSKTELLNMISEDKSYVLKDAIDVSYYNKGAELGTNKIIMFGTRRDNNETICFIFSEENYKLFSDSVIKFMTE